MVINTIRKSEEKKKTEELILYINPSSTAQRA